MQFPVFPCNIHKKPLILDWANEATKDQDKINKWIAQFGNLIALWGVPTGNSQSNILVLDVDTKNDQNGYESLQGLELPPTMTQETRTGGRHYIYKYPSDGKRYVNRVKFKPGLDVRGAGGYICFYGTTNLPISEPPGWLKEASLDEFKETQGAPLTFSPSTAADVITASLEAIRNAPEGESNNVLNIESFKVGQLVSARAITREYAEQVLFKAAKDRGKPDKEAIATIRSGLGGGEKKPQTAPFGTEAPQVHIAIPEVPGPPPRWTPKEFSVTDLLDTTSLRKPQLFQDWSTEDIHLTSADGGTGKTTLKLYEAICLALGERFLGFDCKQKGKTLFITGEDTDKKLAAMLGAIIRQMGLFKDDVTCREKIEVIRQSIIIKKDADLCLISKDRQGFLHPNQDAFRKVMEAVDDFKPKMIVFDPISSFWGSESALNDMNKAVTKFIGQLVERSGACVEIINHMGKESSSKGDLTQFAGRGGSGLPSNARVVRGMRRLSEEEYFNLTGENLDENKSAIYCVISKFTDGSPLLYSPFVIIREGYLFSRKDLTSKKQRELEHQLSDKERVLVYIKQQRLANKYPTKLLVISHFASCGDTLSEQKVKRAIELLKFEGHLGESVREIDNPDMTIKDRVLIVVDSSGNEG